VEVWAGQETIQAGLYTGEASSVEWFNDRTGISGDKPEKLLIGV